MVDIVFCRGHGQQAALGWFPELADEWAAERDQRRGERLDYGLTPHPRPALPGLDPDTMLTIITCPAAAVSVAVLAGTL